MAGGFGGVAADLGLLLGLSPSRVNPLRASFRPLSDEKEKDLKRHADSFRPAPWTNLPLEPSDLSMFLESYAIGGDSWPENGLTLDENRTLFSSKSPNEIATLVVSGLKRKFADLTSPPSGFVH